MNSLLILRQLSVLFACILLGLLANKLKVMDMTSEQKISSLLINVTVPATILSSAINLDLTFGAKELAEALIAMIVLQTINVVSAIVFPRLLGMGKGSQIKRGTFSNLIAYGNTLYIGLPIANSLFGETVVFYIVLLNMPVNLILYSIGIWFLHGKGFSFRSKFKDILLSPCIIASVIAAAVPFFKFPIPSLCKDLLDILAPISTPAALLVIGSSLSRVKLKNTIAQRDVWLLSVVKLLILPVATVMLMRIFITGKALLCGLLISTCVPSGAILTSFCIQYGGDEEIASQGIFITTLLSIVTMPILFSLLV